MPAMMAFHVVSRGAQTIDRRCYVTFPPYYKPTTVVLPLSMTGHRWRKRRIGMICLAIALPLVADEACMDDRFGWCHETQSKAIDTNNATIDLLFPFERSYGNIQPTMMEFIAPMRLPLSTKEGANDVADNTTAEPLQTRTSWRRKNTGHPPSIRPESPSTKNASEAEELPEEDHSSREPQTLPTNIEDLQQKVDYASKSVGAILLESSHSISGTSHLLQKDKDKYAIVACADVHNSYITVGLSEDILVKQIKISNYERYSGSMRHLHIHASTTNNGIWSSDLGIYELSKASETVLELRTPVWARYLKLEFLDYYGNEYYCTVSQISVYGSTMLQGFHEQWDEAEATADPKQDTHPTVSAETAEPADENDQIKDDVVVATSIAADESASSVECGDDGIESLACFEKLVLQPTRSENRSVTEHLCFSSLMISRAPGSKNKPIQPIATKQQQVPLSTHTLADLEPQQQTPETPLVDETRLRNLAELLQRFPNAKCLEQLAHSPKLKSYSSSGHTATHDGGLEPIFTKFSAEIKALQSDVLALSDYSKVSSSCYQSLLLELVMEQQTIQRETAERLAALEHSMNHSWYSHMMALIATNLSEAMNSVHGKRLGSVLGLTSSVWNDTGFCGIVCVLLLAVFLYLGGSRYQGRITIRRRSLLESTQVTEEVSSGETSEPKSPLKEQPVVSAEPVVVSSDEASGRKHHKKRRTTGLNFVSLK